MSSDVPPSSGLEAIASSPEKQPHSAGSLYATHEAKKRTTDISRKQLRSLRWLLTMAQNCGSTGVKVSYPGGPEVSIYLGPKQSAAAAATFKESREATGHTSSSRPSARPAPGQSLSNRSSARERAETWRHKSPRQPALGKTATSSPRPATPPSAQVSRTAEVPAEPTQASTREATVARLAELGEVDPEVVELMLSEAGGDAEKALELMLKAKEDSRVSEEADRQQAAEWQQRAEVAGAEAAVAAERAASKKARKAESQRQTRQRKAAAKERDALAALAPVHVPAPPMLDQQLIPPAATRATRSTPQHRPPPPQHTNSLEQQERPPVRVSVSGQKTQPKTIAAGKAPAASASSAPSQRPTSTATDPGSSSVK
jgi:hypothetical protein